VRRLFGQQRQHHFLLQRTPWDNRYPYR